MLVRSTWPRFAMLFALTLSCAPALVACEADTGEEVDALDEPITSASGAEIAAAQRVDVSGIPFESLTPTGEKLMRASRYWLDAQDEAARYPRPRMCASNVSKVFFLSGINRYDQEGVRNLIRDVTGKGGIAYRMPQSKADFVAKLNTIHGGRIPAGTLVAGMNVRTSAPGDQHVGFIGRTDPDGTVWIDHNNWYRPANENGQRKPHMVSDANLRRGFERQWMSTPWIRIERDAAGKIVNVVSLMPAIDDMDPFNPSFQVTLAVPAEILRELR